MTARTLKYNEAISEALDLCMAADPSVFVMGLGAPDPTMLFGTHKGLAEKYGPKRVIDMPISENAMTGVLLGAAQNGMRPVMTHIRLEFAMLAIDQIVNQAAKWHYMFGGKTSAPMVIRMLVGRGWGQGPQHSQSLQAWFAHVPGLKVIMPATAHDAKGLMIAAIEDDNPVVCIEHRWLYNVSGPVPEGHYTTPIGAPGHLRQGHDVTIAASSYMTLEAIRAADAMREEGIAADVLDVHTLNPFDEMPIVESVRRTGNLIVADTGSRSAGFAAEISARVVEKAFSDLKIRRSGSHRRTSRRRRRGRFRIISIPVSRTSRRRRGVSRADRRKPRRKFCLAISATFRTRNSRDRFKARKGIRR